MKFKSSSICSQIDWAAIDDPIIKTGFNYSIFTVALVSNKLSSMNIVEAEYNLCIEVPGGHRLIKKYAHQIRDHYTDMNAHCMIRWENRNTCVMDLYVNPKSLSYIKKVNKDIIDYDEYILCAAISIELEGKESPVILAGYRHADCFSSAIQLGYLGQIDSDKQGFLTSKGRFIGRDEAKSVARRAGQLKVDSMHHALTTKDIY